MKAITTEFAGLIVLQPKVFADARGSFVKTYHEGLFREAGISFTPREEFFSEIIFSQLAGSFCGTSMFGAAGNVAFMCTRNGVQRAPAST